MLTLIRDVGGTYVPRAIGPLFDSMQWRLETDETDDRVISLTFDDGPTEEGTPALLDVLAEHDVPATHFVLGSHVKQHRRLAEEMLAAGHELANHSWSHIDCWRSSMSTMVSEFRRTDAIIEDVAGRPVRFVRPPYGKFTYPLIQWARRRGQRVVMWDTMPPDFSTRRSVPYMNRVLQRVRPRSIICMHDNKESRTVTPDALRETLPKLIDAGWRFVPLGKRSGGD